MGEINLSKYNLRSDLIIENNKKSTKEIINNITINRTKDNGNYITISFNDITDNTNRKNVSNILIKELKNILKINKIKDNDSCLIIGLGNRLSTPDSLGVKVLDNIIVTNHLFNISTPSKGIRRVSVFSPGVMASTGMESVLIIKSIINSTKPDFIIAIDSLAALSIERISKTIQITDTGIHPGAGIGNNRKELNKNILGIPVIAIGVPTVLLSETIVIDTIDYLYKHIAYIKEYEEINKLSPYKFNYLNKIKEKELNKEDRTNLLGLFGNLNELDKRSLISEVLNNINLNLIVTPLEIDFLIDKLSYLLGYSINNTLHKNNTDI